VRIGIWCDYGFTLEPSEGIGVFVDNLVRGLLAADPGCRITLKAHPGRLAVLDEAVRHGGGRVAVVAEGRVPWHRRLARKPLRFVRKVVGAPRPGRPLAALPDRWLKAFDRRSHALQEHERQRIIADCDVWLLPYVGLDQSFPRPTVVVIHDLVCYHFPEMLSAADLAAFQRLVDRVATDARLVACMSNFIRENDLERTLGLPAERIRVVPPATPSDLGAPADTTAEEPLPDGVTGPFLLYPAAFRPYKNHAWLVDALALLRARDAADWKLVFTGICGCPPDLARRIDRLGLARHVVILGKVSRPALQTLYRRAFATVVPSLYEQGSFPVMEAIHCGCPAVASGIRPLREQFAALGAAMPYLDPADPASLPPIVDRIQADRAGFVAAQQAGFQAMQRYTWRDAADRWLEVLREAADRSQPARLAA